MRMGLFSCDYFVAVVQDVCPQEVSDSGFVGAQRTKGIKIAAPRDAEQRRPALPERKWHPLFNPRS